MIFGIYCIVFASLMIGAGIYSKKWVADASDFILAGRELSFPINTMGVAAIGFAGTTVSLECGFAILYGVKGALAWGNNLLYSWSCSLWTAFCKFCKKMWSTDSSRIF